MKNLSIGAIGCLPSRSVLVGLLGALTLWGCAPMPPMPFDLIDKAQIHHGMLFQSERRVEANIAGKHFQGYYLLASGTAHLQGGIWRRSYPYDTRTDFISNSARATMAAADGERLTCEFIVEDGSAIGECKSTHGQTYQLVTQVR